jgi:23S rRNA pseudouridine1911/1915/1917 synthase
MELPILFEDNALLVVNKPPGIVVNRADSVKMETVQDWAAAYLGIAKPEGVSLENESFYDRAGIVHRIDKETSGCLVIAKTPEVFLTLQAYFKERTVKKAYLALCHGKIVPEDGEIRAPVGRLPWNRERFGIVPGGKDAVTRYHVRESFVRDGEPLTFVELFPETGRTHQIRVHLKYINHPIVGDLQYAGRKTSRDDREWAPRVMLHAWKIAFMHPTNGSSVAIEATMPDDMKRTLPEGAVGQS